MTDVVLDPGGCLDLPKSKISFGQSQSIAALSSSVMHNMLGAANLVDLKLGLTATNRHALVWMNGIGAPAILVRGPAAAIKAATSIKTHAVRMPAMVFVPERNGDQFLAQFIVSCDPESLHELMRQADIGTYIIEEISTEIFRVHIIGSDQDTVDRIERITDGSRVTIIAGRLKELREVANTGVVAGRDLDDVWRCVCNYRNASAS